MFCTRTSADNHGAASLLLSCPASLRSLPSPQQPLQPQPLTSQTKERSRTLRLFLCFSTVLLSPREALTDTQQQWELLGGFINELPNSIQVPGLTVKWGCRVLSGSCRGEPSLATISFFFFP